MKNKYAGQNRNILILAAGTAASAVISILLTAILSALVISAGIGEEGAGKWVYVVWLISSLCGTWLCLRFSKQGRRITILIVPVCYYMLLLISAMCIADGSMEQMLPAAIIILCGGATNYLYAAGNKSQRGKIPKRYR